MIDLIDQAQSLFNLSLSAAQAQQFATLRAELLDWNQRINLTAITDPEAVVIRHFLDSLSVAQVIGFDEGDKVMDVGTGAGFPSLPLAIAYPQVRVTALDGTAKKLKFIEHIAQLLGLKNIRTVHGRAEEIGHMTQHRAIYDVVVARSVARLPTLLEYALPFVKMGGFFVAYKGETASAEISDSAHALYTLGGAAKPIETVSLPHTPEAHHLVTIEKVRRTPIDYPRAAGKPSKAPLGMPESP